MPNLYLKSIVHIFISYLIFIFGVAIFGKGFGAAESLGITLFFCGVAIFFNIKKAQDVVFKNIDFFFIGSVFFVQALTGVLHFHQIINPGYFTVDSVGVDIVNGTYYWDVAYFAYLIDSIAEFRLEEGYFSFQPASSVLHKNYILAFMLSDIFYFGDAYILNFMAINILVIFNTGVLLALIADKVFGGLDINKRRMVFYLVIMQPIAWIPSHTMRDVFGAFIVVLSIALMLFSISKVQKILFSVLSLFLVFQHRSVYFLSIIGVILTQKIDANRMGAITRAGVLLALAVLIYFLIEGSLGKALLSIFLGSQENSMLGGAVNNRNAGVIEHAVKLIIGPFPWTQYYDGTVDGYAGFYSTIVMLQSAWHLTIIYFLTLKIKMIFSSEKLRSYLYMVFLFAIPAFFSLGGMNLYLLPASMLSLIFLRLISLNRFLVTFCTVVGLYICMSAVFYFSRL